jgi:hypothetical protein
MKVLMPACIRYQSCTPRGCTSSINRSVTLSKGIVDMFVCSTQIRRCIHRLSSSWVDEEGLIQYINRGRRDKVTNNQVSMMFVNSTSRFPANDGRSMFLTILQFYKNAIRLTGVLESSKHSNTQWKKIKPTIT